MSEYLGYDEMTDTQRRNVIADAVYAHANGIIDWWSVDCVVRPKAERYELRAPKRGETYKASAGPNTWLAEDDVADTYFVLIPDEKDS